MDTKKLVECINFFNNITIHEDDVTTIEEKELGQLVVIVTYQYKGKTFTTKRLFYKNINFQSKVKHKDWYNTYFGEPVFWLDIDVHDWPAESGTKLEESVIPDIVDEGNTEFIDFIKSIANDNRNGFIQEILAESKSPQYGINLENNNHWHDIVLLIQKGIKAKGNRVDKKYFSRLVFEWDDNSGARTSLEPEFGKRSFISAFYNNIKSVQMEINSNQIRSLLQYKKQIILQGPPGTGKTRMAKQIAKDMVQPKKLGSPLQKINDFFLGFDSGNKEVIKNRADTKSMLTNFQSKFPKENLANLNLEEYCIGKGTNDSFCWWIERGLKPLGYYFPGSARSYLIFWSKEKDEYSTHFKHNTLLSGFENISDAMESIASMISDLVKNKNISAVKGTLGSSLVLKILNSYYPAEYFPINSEKCLKNVLKLFNINYGKMSTIEINVKLQELLEAKNSEFKKDITGFEFSKFLFSNFDLKGEIEVESDEVVIKGEYKIIQFHPAYSYEDFVRGIIVELNSDNHPEYKVVNRTIADYADKALDNPSANYILIIDEINRANLPAVLGELIYALEYRFDENDEENTTVESIYALKNEKEEEDGEENKKLRLPKNLYIIGTMNTADRSVGHIDYAIRRRFAFVDVLPDLEPVHPIAKGIFKETSALFVNNFDEFLITNVIVPANETLSTDFRPEDVWIGHSYFICKKENSDENLADTEAKSILTNKLKYEVLPILKEYIKDGILQDNDQTKSVLQKLLQWS
ncbi:MAG: AAA family ATPase [Chitinophagaceae bacterium]|nr:AAA family ATPase [Chitinophagaceae bacterium]